MINQLFCYISDFLPEELEGFPMQKAQELYSPSLKTNNHGNQAKQSKVTKGERNQMKKQHKLNNDSIQVVNEVTNEQRQRQVKVRRQFSVQQKKDFVAKVQEGCRKGEKITEICSRLGISDRSYQRWKRYVEEGQLNAQNSDDDLMIQNPYL